MAISRVKVNLADQVWSRSDSQSLVVQFILGAFFKLYYRLKFARECGSMIY